MSCFTSDRRTIHAAKCPQFSDLSFNARKLAILQQRGGDDRRPSGGGVHSDDGSSLCLDTVTRRDVFPGGHWRHPALGLVLSLSETSTCTMLRATSKTGTVRYLVGIEH